MKCTRSNMLCRQDLKFCNIIWGTFGVLAQLTVGLRLCLCRQIEEEAWGYYTVEAGERGTHLTCTVSIDTLPRVIAQLYIWQCRRSLRKVSGQIEIEIVKAVKYMLTANCLKMSIACWLRKSRFDIIWFNLLN